jgi:hypothetical protein
MKTGLSLQDLAREIERQAHAKRDLVAPVEMLAMRADPAGGASLFVGGDNFPVSNLAHDQIGAFCGIPAKYYDRCLAERPDLLAGNVNAWMPQDPHAKRLVRTMDGRVRAFLSDAYRPLENVDLAEAALPVLMDLKLEVVSAEITERRLYLKCVDPSINRDIPTGKRMGDGSHTIFDTCVPALVISNSEVGSGALTIESGVWTRACTNLAVFAQSGMKKHHVGARHSLSGVDNIAELLSDDTKRATDKAIWLQVRDVVRGAFDEARFEARLAKITDTANQPIEADVVKVVEFTAKRFDLTDGERSSVLTHLIQGGDLTRYGLHAAITRTAEDLPSYDRASDFERLGGQIIDLPQSQWRDISTASGNAKALALAA